MYKPIYQALPY